MIFNSLHFLIFFPVVTIGFFALPHRHRWLFLLVASCLFYMDFIPAYIAIIGFTIVIDYFAGLLIERASGRRRKLFLVVSLVSNLGILAVFKYADFFLENFNSLLHAFGSSTSLPLTRITLPVGLSFHTFQAMAYTIEVYRGRQQAERHFGIYSLYVMFYPQMVAGPIERPQNILHQFREEKRFDATKATQGLQLMAWGFFQKVVIADRLAMLAGPIFDKPESFHGLALMIAAVAFTFQIYFDFAGYSDIARGAARVMGFELMQNFRRPFFAPSISEFWSRWHISLSTWFRDYLYIPLGGNRVSTPRWYFNLLFVFLLSGFWHGASWNFVIWGALHGTFLVVAIVLTPVRPKSLERWHRLNVFVVFVLVCTAFVFFRASTFGRAMTLLTHIPDGLVGDVVSVVGSRSVSVWAFISLFPHFPSRLDWLVIVSGIGFITAVHRAQEAGTFRTRFEALPGPVRWSAYAGLVYGTLLLAKFEPQQFIYFQF